MRKLLLITLSSLMLLTLSSCAKTVTLHPVTDQDIKIGSDGWVCMSQDYIKTVMKVKLEAK